MQEEKEQLIMRWRDDGTEAQPVILPENCRVVRFPELEDAMEKWLDIVQYGLTNGREDAACYKWHMTDHKGYKESDCLFILENGQPVATVTVICDDAAKEGYIHMVACCESVRGRGFGTLLNKIAVKELKDRKMQTAYLTTDDWRIPAIKSYLRADFAPDISTDDFKERWNAIFEKIKDQK